MSTVLHCLSLILMLGICGLPSTAQQTFDFVEMGTLPAEVSDASGVAMAGQESFWICSGEAGPGVIHEVGLGGELLRTVHLQGAENVDFEDMAQDYNGHLFIGDFGNADQSRIKLTIYKVTTSAIKLDREKSSEENKVFTVTPEVIDYILPYGTIQEKCHLDCEAMIWQDGMLHIFSRDRCGKVNNTMLLHGIPDQAGRYVGEEGAFFKWEDPEKNIVVTGADLSRDQGSLLLLSDDAIHIFYGFKKDRYFEGSYRFIPMDVAERKAIIHLDDCYISVMESGKNGAPGRILKLNLCAVDME